MKKIRGISLIEVIIATGLLAIFSSTLLASLASQLLSSSSVHGSLEGLALAREGLDAARAIRESSWSSLAVGTHGLQYATGTWSFQGTSETIGAYTRTISVTSLSDTERQVISRVSWANALQQIRSISLATNLSNWQNAYVPLLSGNWNNPQTMSSFDLGPGNQATGVAVKNGTVFMTGSAASAAKDDFFSIDVHNLSSPSLAGSINTGPGLNALTVNGNFAYAANSDVTNQFQIINISSTSSPYVVNETRLTGNNSQAISVSVTGTLVLVGTKQDAGQELFLVDVADPSSPQIKSALEISADVNRIFILDNRAYLATASTTHEFVVVNISNPTNPVISASVDLPGSTAALGLYVNPYDYHAYITRQTDGSTAPEVNVYRVTNPDSPVSLGSMQYGHDVLAAFAADGYLFLGTANSNLEFQTYNATNPASLTYISGLNFPQLANDFAFANNVIYVAVRSNDALRIITSQ